MPRRQAGQIAHSDKAAEFYADILRHIKATGVPFLVGGAYAVNAYTGVNRVTKDVDVFCKPGDYPRLLNACSQAGYEVAVEDERWIAKICKGEVFCDVIFGSANAINPVTKEWFADTHNADVLGVAVPLIPPTELFWSKAFIMDRTRFDGNDIAHLVLKSHALINWRRLLSYMDQHWEVLLLHLVRFRYIYPTERHALPDWLLDELLSRLQEQRHIPEPKIRSCRGRVFSRDDFEIDITQWGFADVVGDEKR
jgi:hypothetical protein